jgi:hypothetical protein
MLTDIVEDDEFMVKAAIRTVILLFLYVDLGHFRDKSSS